MTAPILIFAIGNESRGDDALGSLLLSEIDNYLKNKDNYHDFELLEDFQLQIEHALDMQNKDLILFIDAGMDTPAPFAFYRAIMSDEPLLYSHAMTPEMLLKVYAQFYQHPPPDAYILCIKGEQFELGEPPSSGALMNLSSALYFTQQLLLEAQTEAWNRQRTDTDI
jgi:hydrogenase maturation protease